MTDKLPFVSIAIPCLNEAPNIERIVRCALDQDYPGDRVEVLVADGGSSDGTREILRRLAASDRRLRVFDNPERIQAPAMNLMIKDSVGEVIVRLDAHGDYATDYVRRAVEALERTGADNVGGAQRAIAKTFFQRCLCAALQSPLGVGGAAYRDEKKSGWVDTVFLGAFRRTALQRAGLYDPRAITNEDAELNQRIVATGGKIWLSPDVVAHYYPRASFGKLAKQYYRYGSGRARTLLKHKSTLSVRPLLPFASLVTGAALVATRSRFALPAAVAYAAITAAEAVRVARPLGLAGIACVWGIFPVLHASHGAGFAVGLARYALRPDWTADPERLEDRPAAAAVPLSRAAQRPARKEPTTLQPPSSENAA